MRDTRRALLTTVAAALGGDVAAVRFLASGLPLAAAGDDGRRGGKKDDKKNKKGKDDDKKAKKGKGRRDGDAHG